MVQTNFRAPFRWSFACFSKHCMRLDAGDLCDNGGCCDLMPDAGWTIVLDGINNGGCASCDSINGTYIVDSRTDASVSSSCDNIWRYEGTMCGKDFRIEVQLFRPATGPNEGRLFFGVTVFVDTGGISFPWDWAQSFVPSVLPAGIGTELPKKICDLDDYLMLLDTEYGSDCDGSSSTCRVTANYA